MSSSITKRELREQRRAERQAAEAADAAHHRRRRRPCIGAVAVSRSSSPSRRSPRRPAHAQVPPAKSSLFAGIPEHDGVLGDPKAPVTVTEFLDLQCPICAEASKQTLPRLVNDYVRTGKVKLQLRTLHFLGPDSVRAARAAAGAQAQGRLWPFVEAFYAAQGQRELGLRDRRLPALGGQGRGRGPADLVAGRRRQGMTSRPTPTPPASA